MRFGCAWVLSSNRPAFCSVFISLCWRWHAEPCACGAAAHLRERKVHMHSVTVEVRNMEGVCGGRSIVVGTDLLDFGVCYLQNLVLK